MRMIKTIIFDVGGVFVNGSFKNFIDKISEITGCEIKDDDDFQKIFDNWMRGKLTFKQFIEKITGCSIEEKTIEKLFKIWVDNWEFDYEKISFAKKFKGRYRLIILSNADAEAIKSRKIDLLDFFERKFHSFDLGMIKPERNIYEYVLKEIKSKPEECVFIDDKPENVQAAKELGIHGIIFEKKEKLERDLEKLGVFVR